MHETFVRIEGEPFLSRAKAYREAREAWAHAWSAYAKRKGARSFAGTGRHLGFKTGAQPNGWTKPQGKHGWSHPKKGQADEAEIQSMRQMWPEPDAGAVYGDAVLRVFQYETPDGRHGSFSIGSFGMVINGPWVGWIGDVYVGHVPDAEAAVRAHREKNPECIVREPAAIWKMPDGLIPITEAEYELIFAQHKVAEERKSAA